MVRIRKRFRVADNNGNNVWVTLLEGKKRGLQFTFSNSSDVLSDYSVGEEVLIHAESENKALTKWRIIDAERPE